MYGFMCQEPMLMELFELSVRNWLNYNLLLIAVWLKSESFN